MDDWNDLDPAEITLTEDDTSNQWQLAMTGPDSATPTTGDAPNVVHTVKLHKNARLSGSDAYRNNNIFLRTHFESLDNHNQTLVNGGTVTLDGGQVSLAAPANTDEAQISRIKNYALCDPTWVKNRKFKTSFVITASANASYYIISGLYTSSLDAEHVGVKIINGQIYGTVGNGSTETATASLGSISASATYNIEVVFTTGVGAYFYLDGALLGSITTGLPTGVDGAPVLYNYRIKSTGANAELLFDELVFLQED